MLNEKFIRRKLDQILGDIDTLSEYEKMTFDDIAKDQLKMAALERLLEKIIMRAIDINQHIISKLSEGDEKIRGYEDTFIALVSLGVYSKKFGKSIAPSAGLRNRLVHEYDDLDEEIVFKSAEKALKTYTKYCDYVLKFLEEGRGE